MTTTLSSPNTATLGMDGAASLTIAMFGKATIAFTSANDDVWPSFTVTNAQSKTYGPYGINMSVVITALDGSLTYQVNGGVPGFGYDADSNITSLVDGAGNIFDSTPVNSRRPAFLEQHITGFFGRGMLTAETINVYTEQSIVGNAAAGALSIVVTSATNFEQGGCVTIRHDNGVYGTYSIYSKSGATLTIQPALRYDCTAAGSKIERTWLNRAHPGKFYMRELAQRIARSTEVDAAMPSGGRVLFTNFSSNPNTLEDTMVALGGASVSYFAESNTGSSGNATSSVRFTMGRSAFVSSLGAATAGAETQLFDTLGVSDACVKVMLYVQGGGNELEISVIDELGYIRGTKSIAATSGYIINRIYTMAVDLRGATKIKIRIAVKTYGSAGGVFSVSQIDCFDFPLADTQIVANKSAKIVCLGDSWFFGDPTGSAEREPITQQLAIELPGATIINAGVGGNKIWEMLDRFDTDVAPHTPEFVVVNTGTNECYNPASGTFFPNAVDAFLYYYSQLLTKIAGIGARAIVIGPPALAQSDDAVPAFPEWQLNDRAKMYARYMFEWQSAKPFISSGSNANGAWVKYVDGSMTCSHSVSVTTTGAATLGSTVWTFPVLFVAAPKVTTSCSDYASAQNVSSGTGGTIAASTVIKLVTSASGATFTIDCVAVGRWK